MRRPPGDASKARRVSGELAEAVEGRQPRHQELYEKVTRNIISEIAEIGAAMTCAHLEVKGELRHASYVDNWLKVLKGDSKAILTAASLASKAADYLRAFSAPNEERQAA